MSTYLRTGCIHFCSIMSRVDVATSVGSDELVGIAIAWDNEFEDIGDVGTGSLFHLAPRAPFARLPVTLCSIS